MAQSKNKGIITKPDVDVEEMMHALFLWLEKFTQPDTDFVLVLSNGVTMDISGNVETEREEQLLDHALTAIRLRLTRPIVTSESEN